jgi:hypothetical protein
MGPGGLVFVKSAGVEANVGDSVAQEIGSLLEGQACERHFSW